MGNSHLRSIPKVNFLSTLAATSTIGDIIFCEDTKQLYIYTDNGWTLYTPAAATESGLNLNLMELNRAIISQLDPFPENNVLQAKEIIDNWCKNINNHYYMLYGKEISYFTVFTFLNGDIAIGSLGAEVLDCLNNIGPIYSIELTLENDAIEIWVKQDDLMTCLYLFPYDNGIVTIGM